MALYKSCVHCRSKYNYYGECTCEGAKKQKQKNQEFYDKHIRKSDKNKKYDDFYHSKEWRRLADHMKHKYHNLCVKCLMESGIPINQDTIHHILEIRTDEGWLRRLDADMLIPLCHDCHNELHSNYTDKQAKRLMEVLNEYNKKYGV